MSWKMRNVIFDLGGVVFDWNPQKVKRDYQGNKALPEFLFKSGFFQEYWTEFDRGTFSEAELIGHMARLSAFPEEECRGFVEFIKYSLTDLPRTLVLIRELFQRGFNLYCLSNMGREFYDYLKEREVFRYFKGQVISALVGMVKPEEGIYRLLLERFQLKPDESLFIDDLRPNIETAESLGLHTLLFADKERGYRELNRLFGF